jgi:hypothetical protein
MGTLEQMLLEKSKPEYKPNKPHRTIWQLAHDNNRKPKRVNRRQVKSVLRVGVL